LSGLFLSGISVHNRDRFLGAAIHKPPAVPTPHAPGRPLQLQGHAGPAWYRDIWVRGILGYGA